MTDDSEVMLVVDDEQSDVQLIQNALEGAGFTVVAADCYNSAIEVFQAHAGDIVMAVVDVSLPRRNGIELVKQLLRRKPSLRVLFVSGHVGAEVIRFYGLPATDRHFLQKPFAAAALVARVQEILKSPEAWKWFAADAETAEDTNGRADG